MRPPLVMKIIRAGGAYGLPQGSLCEVEEYSKGYRLKSGKLNGVIFLEREKGLNWEWVKPEKTPSAASAAAPRQNVPSSPASAPAPASRQPVQGPAVITTRAQAVSALDQIKTQATWNVVGFGCKGADFGATADLALAQIAYRSAADEKTQVLLFDILALKAERGGMEPLQQLLEDRRISKVGHGLHMDAAALQHQFDIALTSTVDTQLLFEIFARMPMEAVQSIMEKTNPDFKYKNSILGKKMDAKSLVWNGVADFLELCGARPHAQKATGRMVLVENPAMWKERPLPPTLMSYAAADVASLLDVYRALLDNQTYWSTLRDASIARCKTCQISPESAHKRGVVITPDGVVQSVELRDAQMGDAQFVKLKVHDNVDVLLNYIPAALRPRLLPIACKSASPNREVQDPVPPLSQLRDVIIEVGQRPYAYFNPHKRVCLHDNAEVTVTTKDVEYVARTLRFGHNNRASLDGSLHQISAMRAKDDHIYSLTFRVGRAIVGNAHMMADVVAHHDQSVLLIGPPGSGKTTLMRDMARVLSQDPHTVIIVDTNNEICGDGILPHSGVGMARRMMVRSFDCQADVLIEAMQNHKPDIVICDEIRQGSEIEAMRALRQRGTRCISSVNGTLRTLVGNTLLRCMVGGAEAVTGDSVAIEKERTAHGGLASTLPHSRPGTVFDTVIELMPGEFNEWRLVRNVAAAVDDILAGKQYESEIRRRDPTTGHITTELAMC